jgi:hypothetical protein
VPSVYCYTRFSDPKQAVGSSLDRQVNYATKWAIEHGMEVDEPLSLKDEGLSAYHQRHVKFVALGVFLRDVEDGRVESGSVLIVERELTAVTERTATPDEARAWADLAAGVAAKKYAPRMNARALVRDTFRGSGAHRKRHRSVSSVQVGGESMATD